MELRLAMSQIDGAKHRENMVLLDAAVNSTTADEFRDAVGLTILSVFDEVFMIGSSSVNSKTFVVYDDDNHRLLVVGCGMTGRENVLAIMAGWADPLVYDGESPPPFWVAASIIVPLLTPEQLANVREATLIGHSYGGATMMALHLKLYQDYRHIFTTTWTYGAPKPYVGRGNPWDGRHVIRVWLPNDPVVNLPPNLQTTPLIFGVPGRLAGLQNWPEWRQTVTGYVLGRGELSPSRSSGAPVLYFMGDLANWLVGQYAFGSDEHSLRAYKTAMQAVPEVPLPQSQPVAEAVVGSNVRRPTQVERRRAEDGALANAGLLVAADPVGEARRIIANTPVVRGVRFTRRRYGRSTYIFYGEEIVAVCTQKREARRILKTLNASLR